MYRYALVAAAALAALATVGLANSASGPGSQLANQDRLYGGGSVTAPDGTPRNFGLDAHAAASAGGAYGDIEYGGTFHDEHEQVTCLSVRGNMAAVGGIVVQADRPEIVGMYVLQLYADDGTPASGTPDQGTLQDIAPAGDPGWPAGFPYLCPTPDAALANPAFGFVYLPLGGGDVTVYGAG
jgi:hypothetical protein